MPGFISQGNTRKEALNNIREAVSVYLKSLKAYDDEPVPPRFMKKW
ncbi:MAG: type II toxin-antitoxin system HicB family antitoxin [Desulfococcaceae bacterium]